jgi:hypothetical protein
MATGLQLPWDVCDVTLGAKIVNGRSVAARSIRTSEINVKQAYLELLRLRRLVREAKKIASYACPWALAAGTAPRPSAARGAKAQRTFTGPRSRAGETCNRKISNSP